MLCNLSREIELVRSFINDASKKYLYIHGPRNTGKTTVIDKVLAETRCRHDKVPVINDFLRDGIYKEKSTIKMTWVLDGFDLARIHPSTAKKLYESMKKRESVNKIIFVTITQNENLETYSDETIEFKRQSFADVYNWIDDTYPELMRDKEMMRKMFNEVQGDLCIYLDYLETGKIDARPDVDPVREAVNATIKIFTEKDRKGVMEYLHRILEKDHVTKIDENKKIKYVGFLENILTANIPSFYDPSKDDRYFFNIKTLAMIDDRIRYISANEIGEILAYGIKESSITSHVKLPVGIEIGKKTVKFRVGTKNTFKKKTTARTSD